MSLKVFVFPGAWGLASTGPFALKLLAWLRMVGLEHDIVETTSMRRAPKGKNPWIELDGQPIGDTELIMAHLSRLHGLDPDAWLDPVQRATALAFRRMIEEHLHQVLEYELLVSAPGQAAMRAFIAEQAPSFVAGFAASMMARRFGRQLHARGVGRHAPDEIAAMGIADLQALELLLGDGPWLLGDRACSLDAVAYGFLGPLVRAPVEQPVMGYARNSEALRRFVERAQAAWFPELAAEAAA